MRRALAHALLAAAILVVTGCGGDEDDGRGSAEATETAVRTERTAGDPRKRADKAERAASPAGRRALRAHRAATTTACVRARADGKVSGPPGPAGLRSYLRRAAPALDRIAADVAESRPPKPERAAVRELERKLSAAADLYRGLQDRSPEAGLVRLTDVIERRVALAAAAARLPACSPF